MFMNRLLCKRIYAFVLAAALPLAGCGGGSAPRQMTPPPDGPELAISSSEPPAGSAGISYAGNGFSLTASGGTAPYIWTWKAAIDSSLPSGLGLSLSGLISGVPDVAATYKVVVKVEDSSVPALDVTASYAIVIAGASVLTITSAAPPDGTVGVDYGPSLTQTFSCRWSPVFGWHEVCISCAEISCSSLPPCKGISINPCGKTEQVFEGFTFMAAGGAEPYTWSASGMPPGIDVDANSGQVLGTPITAGSYSVSITVTDAATPPAQAIVPYVINIGSATGGRCVGRGGPCYAGHSCCAGLHCVAATTRAFCE